MEKLMIVNPRKRKRGRRKTSKAKTRTRTMTKTKYVYRTKSNPRRKSRRRRYYRKNPAIMGIDIFDLAGGTGIGIGSRMLPGLLNGFGIPIPATGIMGYLSQLVSGLGLSYVVGNVLGMKGMGRKGNEITIALLLERIVNDMILSRPEVAGLLGKPNIYMEGISNPGLLGQGVYDVASTGDSSTSRTASRTGARIQIY